MEKPKTENLKKYQSASQFFKTNVIEVCVLKITDY